MEDWLHSPKVWAEERRLSSIHEAGHFVIARHFRISGWAWIGPSSRKPHPDHKLWVGQFKVVRGALDGLSLIRRQMVAVAGAVAGECWTHRFEDDCSSDDWSHCLWDPDWMSETDWKTARHQPGQPSDKLYRACEAVFALLMPGGPLWPVLLTTSRDLIRHGEVGLLPTGGAYRKTARG